MDLADASPEFSALREQPEIGVAARQALVEVERARAACLAPDGGCEVLRCVRLCAVNGVALPQWLGDEFARLHELVVSAEAGTWSDAFGTYWPRGTHLSKERQRMSLRPKVHARVWGMVRDQPARPINRDLFEEVGEAKDIAVSGAVAERLYYESLSVGALNIAAWRESELASPCQSRNSAKF